MIPPNILPLYLFFARDGHLSKFLSTFQFYLRRIICKVLRFVLALDEEGVKPRASLCSILVEISCPAHFRGFIRRCTQQPPATMPPFEFRGNAPPKKGQRNHPRPEFTFRARLKTAERPLLQGKRETTPEMLTTDGVGEKQAPKFASLDDLSDSEEAEMDFSEDSDEETRPSKRRAVASESNKMPISAPLPPVPKWSNPDPYTSLPPPDESQQKRVDVVKLIRKAKLQNNLAQTKDKDAVAENDDFISLGAMDDLMEQGPGDQAPENAPTGPRSMQTTHESAAVSRKRTHDVNGVGLAPKAGKPVATYNRDASIVSEWRAFPGQNATPWVTEYPLSPEIKSATSLGLPKFAC